MKYVIFFIFYLIIIIINLTIINNSYYFITPIFMVNPTIYKTISTIIFILVTLSIFLIFKDNKHNKRLQIILLINFSLYFLYNLFTFKIISPFLAFTAKIFHFIATLYLNEEIVFKNKISAKLLVPYIIWTFYLTLTSISIFFINNS